MNFKWVDVLDGSPEHLSTQWSFCTEAVLKLSSSGY